ncbi:MAG: PQQ-dependent sugar dehydrogenase [Flavobacteriales bacterium]
MKKWIVTAFAAFSTLIGAQAQTWQVGNTTLTESDLVTGLTLPWEILWGPDDYIWCTTRPGLLLRIDPATGNYVTVLNKSTVVPNDGDGEPGMLGMALHPDFLNTPTVYVVYNYMQGNNVKERLSAFTWDGSALVNEVTLIDAIGGNYIHDGSRLLITPDQKILMTTGDTGDGGVSSQNITSLNGKTLRINLDGSIPSDNPDPASYVWSYGHRNGQGLCIGPNGIIYESEHGQSNSDELNIIEPNRNYGWPTVQGACNTTAEQTYCAANNVKEPLLEWSPCRAVNGLEYYNHPAVPEWNNCILMAVLGGLSSNYERMTVIHLSTDGLTATSVDAEDTYFQSFNRRIRDLCVNPNTGELYVAFNGAQYPGSGPNAIKKFSNLEYLGIQNNGTKGQNITLFPNPIEDTARLEFTSSFLGSTCQVFSFSGQLMGEFKVDQTNMSLDCTTYAPGNYFLSATSSEGTISRTFVVK